MARFVEVELEAGAVGGAPVARAAEADHQVEHRFAPGAAAGAAVPVGVMDQQNRAVVAALVQQEALHLVPRRAVAGLEAGQARQAVEHHEIGIVPAGHHPKQPAFL